MSGFNKLLTFWQLLKDYDTVEIPIIQRDYAHGREKEERVRDGFIESLKEAFTVKAIVLHYIYGNIQDEGSEKPRNKVFVPLDGQQRLTTLFLLHWYLACKDGKLSDDVQEILARFTYEVRDNSRDFCKRLCRYDWVEDKSSYENESGSLTKKLLSERISDQEWFFMHWKKDPTIASMLNMLDSIDDKKAFGTEDAAGWFDRLTDSENPAISFVFEDLAEEFKQGELLYVRMNARGKKLTAFEVFKSYLKEESDKHKVSDLLKLIDTDWTDYFWECKKEYKKIDMDKTFLAVLKATINNAYFKRIKSEDYKELTTDAFSENERDISFKQRINKEVLLDLIAHMNNITAWEVQLPKHFAIDASTAEDKDQGTGYAQMLGLHSLGLSCDDDWLRVTRNLIGNMRWNDFSNYAQALQAMSQWAAHAKGGNREFLGYASENSEFAEAGGFSKELLREEAIKAKLILTGYEWEDAIVQAERHGYFRSIGFVFGLLDVYSTADVDDADKKMGDPAAFDAMFEKIEAIWDKDGLREELDDSRQLFRRALLCFGDYSGNIGNSGNRSFWTDERIGGHRTSWRTYLSKYFDKENTPQELRELLGHISGPGKVEEELSAVIDKELPKIKTADWRKGFIEFPEVWEKTVQLFVRFGFNEDRYKNIRLLKGQKLSEDDYEYYGFWLYCTLKKEKRADKVSYAVVGERSTPVKCLACRNGGKKAYVIYKFSQGDEDYRWHIFKSEDFSGSKADLHDSMVDTIDALKQDGYL